MRYRLTLTDEHDVVVETWWLATSDDDENNAARDDGFDPEFDVVWTVPMQKMAPAVFLAEIEDAIRRKESSP